mmetsp:Transcript_105019/g.186024  ORF Transcript_105019/g.186024 Transcript_105019/m.186024 type:complete len:190 (-) Transcript_105019:22-591(-)
MPNSMNGGHHSTNGVPSRKARLSVASLWAVLGVALFIMNGMRRLVPIALLPFQRGLGIPSWVAYLLTCAFFAYVEGYRGFQQRFSPLVVRRALLLNGKQPAMHQACAPAYAMAFFHATRRRRLVSWVLVISIIVIVALVKRLPYPYRSILDAGVCVGLTWGIGSIMLIFARSVKKGHAPDTDPCLPEQP